MYISMNFMNFCINNTQRNGKELKQMIIEILSVAFGILLSDAIKLFVRKFKEM